MPPPAFATHDDLKALLGRPDLDNGQCDFALRSASATIRNYTKQYLSPVANDTVQLEGTWGQELWLPEKPVTAVHSIVLNSPPFVANFTLPTTDYMWSRRGKLIRLGSWGLGWPVYPDDLVGGYWGGSQGTVTVTYDHGYATLPDDIWGVCLAVAGRLVTNPTNVLRESIDAGGLSVSTQYARTMAADLEPEEQAKLNLYRKRQSSLYVGK